MVKTEMRKKRDPVIDIVRGILMISVLLGHTYWQYSDYIYYFHMPAFFILSGMLVNSKKQIQIKTFMIDFLHVMTVGFCWYIIDLLIHDKLTLKLVIMYFWGGRLLSGVYWFMPVLVISQCLFIAIERLHHKYIIYLVLLVLSIIESYVLRGASLPLYLNVPLNVDACLIAIVYLKIGAKCKEYLNRLSETQSRSRLALTGIGGGIVVAAAIMLNQYDLICHKFDMKYINYGNPVLALVVPVCAFFFIFSISSLIVKNKIFSTLFETVGRSTIDIMYSHLLILYIFQWFFGEKYSIAIYVITALLCSLH